VIPPLLRQAAREGRSRGRKAGVAAARWTIENVVMVIGANVSLVIVSLLLAVLILLSSAPVALFLVLLAHPGPAFFVLLLLVALAMTQRGCHGAPASGTARHPR